MYTVTNVASKLWRILRFGGVRAVVLVAALALAPILAGCQTNAQDEDFRFNNPLDPNQDEDDDGGSGSGQVVIAMVNTDPDIVVIVNTGTEDTNIGNWTLENENDPTPDVYTFGGGLTLGEGDFIRVHSGAGTDTSLDVFTGSTAPDWGPAEGRDIARLKNGGGVTIFTCQDGNTCWQ